MTFEKDGKTIYLALTQSHYVDMAWMVQHPRYNSHFWNEESLRIKGAYFGSGVGIMPEGNSSPFGLCLEMDLEKKATTLLFTSRKEREEFMGLLGCPDADNARGLVGKTVDVHIYVSKNFVAGISIPKTQ